jgi:hypothetical protein
MATKPDPKAEQELLLGGLRVALDGQPRLLQGPPAKHPLYPGGAKGTTPAKQALDQGYVEVSDPPVGVKATKTQTFVRLTEKGRRFILDQDDPRKILEELAPVVKGLAANIETLRQEFVNRLEMVTGALQHSMNMIEEVLSRPRARSAEVEVEETSPPTVPPIVEAPAPEPEILPPPPVAPPLRSPPLEDSIHRAYDKLRHFEEYRDGLVEVPHLYDETQELVPDLTIPQFQEKLTALWNDRKVELHILNEVAKAREPEKAITRNDTLYYYLLWK